MQGILLGVKNKKDLGNYETSGMNINKPIFSNFPEIRLAEALDLPILLDLFADVREGLQEIGVDQWGPEYPNPDQITKDLDLGRVFVFLADKRIVGTITLDQTQHQQYQGVLWQYEAERVGVIHRLAVLPEFWGHGYAKKLCQFAEAWASQQGWEVLRLDTYSKNPASLGLYQKLGYTKAEGACFFHGNPQPFCLFEKRVSGGK